MRLKYLLLASLFVVLMAFTGVSIYWWMEPQIIFTQPIVKIIRQYKGEAVSISISHDRYAAAGDFKLTLSIINARGYVVHRSVAKALKVGRKYIVLTDPDLEPGIFDVVAKVEYRLNPMRTVSEEVQIAILKVMEEK